ncbi:MAG: ureidoglycolate lyase [Chloroflexota bacterium]|jgi:ureidoglycolate lyase|nr:ureidoglycolate lyase [Chloroflexota bacterium]
MTAVGTQKEITLHVQPLTPEAFAPYGRVVLDDRQPLQMQEGQFTARLMTVKRAPETIDRINRHMDHSQMFVPLNGDRTVIVVAPPAVPMEGFDATQIAAFTTDGQTTVIFHPGTWHIEPRALGKDDCQVLNVQTDVFREHTELISLPEQGFTVRLQLD